MALLEGKHNPAEKQSRKHIVTLADCFWGDQGGFWFSGSKQNGKLLKVQVYEVLGF